MVPGRARALIEEAPIPPEVDAAIRTAYTDMGGTPPVAVRSSATAEDLPFASFAGQQDSFLDVVGADAVVEAVRRCWASLWSDRAVAYRSANGISNRDVELAVVVQAMADSATAGVLFTANPVTGTRTETVINASPGSGQAVVSGSVNPDQFVLDTASGLVTLRTPGGPDSQRSPVLSEPQLQELTALGARVQRLLGAPQDIEWAIDAAGTIWLTQSRPITTLYPLPEPAPEDAGAAAPTRVYLCGTLFQGLTRPITPLGLAVLELMRNSKGPWRYVNPGHADVRGPDGGAPQPVRPRLSAADAPLGGRQIRCRPPGAARGSAVRPCRTPVPGRPAQGRDRAPRPATAPAHRQHRENSQPRPHRRVSSRP